jgi:holo-[acyl-carrier protein] synthase
MIVGIGTDTVVISRVKAILNRWGDRFVARILGPDEQKEYQRRLGRGVSGADRAVRYLAKRFAAKEAVGKALGVGLHQPMSLHAVQILNNPKGAPMVQTAKALRNYIDTQGYQIHISLSDELENAQAFAVIEQK